MLDSKQRAYLRKLSSEIDSSFQIGKGGITKNLLAEIKNALDKNELVKISLLDTMIDQTSDDKKEIADKLAKGTLSNVVSVLGKKIVLYKRSSKKVKILFPDEVAKKEKEAKAKQRKLRAKTSTIMRGKENKEKAIKAKKAVMKNGTPLAKKPISKDSDKDKKDNKKDNKDRKDFKKTKSVSRNGKPLNRAKKTSSRPKKSSPIRNVKKSTKKF